MNFSREVEGHTRIGARMSAPVSPARVAKRPLEERLSSPRPPSQRKKGVSPAKAPRRITPSVEAGVRHVVLGALKESATEAQKEALLAGFRALPDSIPQILHLDCGIDLGLAKGNHGGFVATVDFADGAAYKVYATHAAHLEFIEKLVKPVLVPGSRIASQFTHEWNLSKRAVPSMPAACMRVLTPPGW